MGGKAQQQLAASGMFDVYADAALRQVVAQKCGAHLPPLRVEHIRLRASPRFAEFGMLHLDHIGTQSAEELRAERQSLHLFHRQDAHAV